MRRCSERCNKRPDLCLFDLDGTLIDPFAGISKSILHALRAFGIQKEPDELKKYIGPPIRDNFRDMGIAEGDIERAVGIYREMFEREGIFDLTVYPGIAELLKCLRDAGIVAALATLKVASYAEDIVKRLGFSEYFAFISGGDRAGVRNTKSEIITHALDTLDPHRKMRPVMIGDREFDIIGAKQTGIAHIGVTWGYGSRQELLDAGAALLADTPEELWRIIHLGDS